MSMLKIIVLSQIFATNNLLVTNKMLVANEINDIKGGSKSIEKSIKLKTKKLSKTRKLSKS